MEENITNSDIYRSRFWSSLYLGKPVYPELCRYLLECPGLGVNEFKVLLVLIGYSRANVFRFTPKIRRELCCVCFPDCGFRNAYDKFSLSFRKLKKAGIIVGIVGGNTKDYRIKQKFD